MATAGSCHGASPFAEFQLGTCFWFSQCCQPGQSACTGQYRLPPAPEPPVVCGDEGLSLEPTILAGDAARTWRDYCVPDEVCVDSTKYNPWRYPGKAPVLSSCGMAGGWKTATQVLQPANVRPGMDGVDLPPLREPAQVWRRGSTAEVAFSIYVNHGGGYAYRLCPSNEPLTEACFSRGHLNFVGVTSWVQFGASRANRTAFPATRVRSEGRLWSKNPIPPCAGIDGGDYMSPCDSPMWPPPLPGPWPQLWGIGLGRCFPSNGTHPAGGGDKSCSEAEERAWAERFGFNIVDEVAVPVDIAAGSYTLSWRWDVEQTPQVWTNCADIQIV